jgi:hypothetical protein
MSVYVCLGLSIWKWICGRICSTHSRKGSNVGAEVRRGSFEERSVSSKNVHMNWIYLAQVGFKCWNRNNPLWFYIRWRVFWITDVCQFQKTSACCNYLSSQLDKSSVRTLVAVSTVLADRWMWGILPFRITHIRTVLCRFYVYRELKVISYPRVQASAQV